MNLDSWPVLSQGKSLVQVACGDFKGAGRTWQNFTRRCPIVSQIRSLGEAVGGDPGAARRTQMEFAETCPVVRPIYHAATGRMGNISHDYMALGAMGTGAAVADATAGAAVAAFPPLAVGAAAGLLVGSIAGEIVNQADPAAGFRRKCHEWLKDAAVLILVGVPNEGEFWAGYDDTCQGRMAEALLGNMGACVVAFWDSTDAGRQGTATQCVDDFLKRYARNKRFVFYSGHGSAEEGSWHFPHGESISPTQFRGMLIANGGADRLKDAAVYSNNCYSGHWVNTFQDLAFVAAPGKTGEVTFSEGPRWFFNDKENSCAWRSVCQVGGHACAGSLEPRARGPSVGQAGRVCEPVVYDSFAGVWEEWRNGTVVRRFRVFPGEVPRVDMLYSMFRDASSIEVSDIRVEDGALCMRLNWRAFFGMRKCSAEWRISADGVARVAGFSDSQLLHHREWPRELTDL